MVTHVTLIYPAALPYQAGVETGVMSGVREPRTSPRDSSATSPWCNCCECTVCWATTALPWCHDRHGWWWWQNSTDTLHQSTCNPNKEYVGGMYCIYDLGSNVIVMWGILYIRQYFRIRDYVLGEPQVRLVFVEGEKITAPWGQPRQHPNTAGESFNQMGEVKQQFNQEMKINLKNVRLRHSSSMFMQERMGLKQQNQEFKQVKGLKWTSTNYELRCLKIWNPIPSKKT